MFRATRGVALAFTLAGAAGAILTACGGGPEPAAPIARETPEDQILRLGSIWESREEENGFRNPPSHIALFQTHVTSTITFQHGERMATEALRYDESVKTTDGVSFHCQAEASTPVSVKFAGNHADAAAVEVRRPTLRLARKCTPSGFPEPILELPQSDARFGLRGDQLVSFAPPSDKRVYLPIQ